MEFRLYVTNIDEVSSKCEGMYEVLLICKGHRLSKGHVLFKTRNPETLENKKHTKFP